MNKNSNPLMELESKCQTEQKHLCRSVDLKTHITNGSNRSSNNKNIYTYQIEFNGPDAVRIKRSNTKAAFIMFDAPCLR